MPLWLLLAPRIADVVISRGVQEVKNLGAEEIGRQFLEDTDGADGRGRGADRRTGGRADVGQRRGGRVDGGQMGARADDTQNEGGRAHESGWTDGRMGRGFKRPRTSFPTSLSCAQTTCLTAERVCRALGSALGSWPGLHYFFLLRTTYLQFRHNTIVKCVPELF